MTFLGINPSGIPNSFFSLSDITEKEYEEFNKIDVFREKLNLVKGHRLASKKLATQKLAETPHLFDEIKQPKSNYIAIPVVSSQRRKYIPIDLKKENIIAGNKIFVLENGSTFEFGILTSSAHNDWMRLSCGRMKSDYSYSGTIVYNTFPFPTVTDDQKKHIEQLAEEILLTREDFAGDTLAKLYDPDTMPESLKIAHQNLDDAVDKLYNPKGFADTASRLAHLLERYESLINAEKQQAIDKKAKKTKVKKE